MLLHCQPRRRLQRVQDVPEAGASALAPALAAAVATAALAAAVATAALAAAIAAAALAAALAAAPVATIFTLARAAPTAAVTAHGLPQRLRCSHNALRLDCDV